MRRIMLLVGAATLVVGVWVVPGEAGAAIPQVKDVAAASGHTCAVVYDGSVWCWGSNDYGQTGPDYFGATEPPPRPNPVPGISNALQVAVGANHSCGLSADHKVHCWGRSNFGQVGPGSAYSGSGTAREVSGLPPVVELSAGVWHTCARTSAGAVYCWGDNEFGQLGSTPPDGRASTSRPLLVAGIGSATSVSAGAWHTCATTQGGSSFCWGRNRRGQLGNTSNVGTDLPNQDPLPSATGVSHVSAGTEHTCARAPGRRVKCWGANHVGQLGQSVNNGTSTPNPDGVLARAIEITAVSSGGSHTCAIGTDARARCWGYNSLGQMGQIANRDANPSPRVVPGISNVTDMTLGGAHTCAIHNGGKLSCWGMNNTGQLARNANVGTLEPNPTPTVVDLPKPPGIPPRGQIVLSVTDGRGYGMLAWAIDPDDGRPARMRVVIPGVLYQEYEWNYLWSEMPEYSGVQSHHALLVLARLPPGEHRICFDAQDSDTSQWHRIECRTHTVK